MAEPPPAAVDEAGGVADVVWVAVGLGVEDGDAGADEGVPVVGVLVVGAFVGALIDVLEVGGEDCWAGIPPCTVTMIPPGWNAIRAVHCPLGAADVAVAVTARLCPGASVPEC